MRPSRLALPALRIQHMPLAMATFDLAARAACTPAEGDLDPILLQAKAAEDPPGDTGRVVGWAVFPGGLGQGGVPAVAPPTAPARVVQAMQMG